MKIHLILICNAIVQAVAFISITAAAVLLNSPGVLWWYIVPLLMAALTSTKKEG